MTRSPKCILAACALSLAAAAPASADSIAYLKGGDMWLTTSDMSRQYQVTATGDYTSVSQADDGTLLGKAGTSLRRVDRTGKVLSQIATPVSSNPAGATFLFTGPWDADISPDGTKAAYGFISSGFRFDQGCGCVVDNTGNGVGFTKSDALTGFTDAGYKYEKAWDGPEWIDNDTVLMSNGPGWPSDPIAVRTVSSGTEQGYFTDPNNMHPLDGTMSRNQRVMAFATGDRQQLQVYRDDDGHVLGGVHACFYYSDDTAHSYGSPTFNADGTQLVWATGKGLASAPVGAMTGKCADGVNSTESLPGASSPDWGPADVPPARAIPAPTPAATATPAGTPAPHATATATATPAPEHTGPPAVQPKLAFTVASTKLKTILKSGLRLAVTAPTTGAVTAEARAGAKLVAKGTGAAAVKLSFTKAAKRKLKHARRTTLQVTVAQGTATTTAPVTLTR